MRGIRGIRLSSRRIIVLVLVLGLLVELPLAYVFFLRGRTGGATAANVTSTTSTTATGGIGNLTPHPIAVKFKPDSTKLADCR